MPATTETTVDRIRNSITSRVPRDTIKIHLELARSHLASDMIDPSHRFYEGALFLYTIHLLYVAGFVRIISAESDGFARNLYAVTPLTSYKGSTYIELYNKLVGDPLLIIRV